MLLVVRNRERVLTCDRHGVPTSRATQNQCLREKMKERGWARRRRSEGAREREGMRLRVRVRVRGNESESEIVRRQWVWVICLSVFEFEWVICVEWWTCGGLNWNWVQKTRFPFKLNRVQRTRFSLNQTESNELDFWAYVDSLSTLAADAMGKSSTIYLIYYPKIESFGLELLDTQILSNLC